MQSLEKIHAWAQMQDPLSKLFRNSVIIHGITEKFGNLR